MGQLHTFSHTRGRPSLRDAAAALGVREAALDPAFGVIVVNPDKHLYTVRTVEGKASVAANPTPYSDPRIEPFGPPQ